MNGETSRTFRNNIHPPRQLQIKNPMRLYRAIEINLLLWFLSMGILFDYKISQGYKAIVIVGFIFAALMQHWGYYSIYKKHLDAKKNEGLTTGSTADQG